MRTIAIVAGGDSSEYVVSVKSAEAVNKVLSNRYKTYTIMIEGSNWYWCDNKGMAHRVDKNDFSLIVNNEKVRFDAVFIAIHGSPGENGLLQGYFDMIGVPYTGSNALCAAVTFSKQTCKAVLAQYGIAMAPSILITEKEHYDIDTITGQVGLPCFVKPDESGSSFGVTRVTTAADLPSALEKAFHEGDRVVAESELKGREVTCGLIKTRKREMVFPVTEILSKNEFFDYDAKYTPSLCDEITPADLPDSMARKVQDLASRIYDYMNCRGLARVDFIIVNETPYFLEVNIVPGMTTESILPQQAAAYGIKLEELYPMVVEELFDND